MYVQLSPKARKLCLSLGSVYLIQMMCCVVYVGFANSQKLWQSQFCPFKDENQGSSA